MSHGLTLSEPSYFFERMIGGWTVGSVLCATRCGFRHRRSPGDRRRAFAIRMDHEPATNLVASAGMPMTIDQVVVLRDQVDLSRFTGWEFVTRNT
ncbi:hypothetical protein V5E97_03915 [Singulisphaera sp. Ch08]|uniref:Uncharacterized protein n=1 Tax=Singulisphaera sp. Ch08 TaxID=3120278 RepID=A0AAU7CJR7_9BACT